MSPDLPDLPIFTEKLETQISIGNFSITKCWQLIQHFLKPRLGYVSVMTTSLWFYDASHHKIKWTPTKKEDTQEDNLLVGMSHFFWSTDPCIFTLLFSMAPNTGGTQQLR